MRKIFKYPLDARERQEISMPIGAKILCVQMQDGEPKIWADVNESLTKEDRSILIFGTGSTMPLNDMKYIGTYQVAGGRFVFHVYELLKP